MTQRAAFSRGALEADGFIGWLPIGRLRDEGLPAIERDAGGLYVVYRPAVSAALYLERSPAGWFRGDPTVDATVLAANWVDEANVVYIGQAKHARLRARLRELEGFAAGKRRPHHGGRLLWQLADSDELLIAWKALPTDAAPLSEETALIQAFRRAFGKPPFANHPDRLGGW